MLVLPRFRSRGSFAGGESQIRGISGWVDEKSRVSSSLGSIHGGREEKEEDGHNREKRENVGGSREGRRRGVVSCRSTKVPHSLSFFLLLFQAVRYLKPLV